MADTPSVIGVIVTYNPDFDILTCLVDKISPQVASLILVDNNDGVRLGEWLARKSFANVSLSVLGENRGLATAQNAGIAWARSQGAAQVLIFDQDTIPPVDLVARLQAALAVLEQQGKKVAAVGPRYIDNKLAAYRTPSPFSRFRNGFISQCYPEGNSPYVPVDFLIASGSLIPIRALDVVGIMSDELFIDYIDIEWGLRARQTGWDLYGIWDIVMEHSLGDDRVVVAGRAFPVHSALRHYYAIRNVVWLCTRSRLNWTWKFGIAYNGLRRFIAYSLFMPQPLKHFRFMCLGLWHGACGRMGKL